MSSFAGRTALITGGGTGMGRAFALALAERGASVAVCGRRPEPIEDATSATVTGPGNSRLEPSGSVIWIIVESSGEMKKRGL